MKVLDVNMLLWDAKVPSVFMLRILNIPLQLNMGCEIAHFSKVERHLGSSVPICTLKFTHTETTSCHEVIRDFIR